MPDPSATIPGLAVWAVDGDDSESQKLAARLGVPLLVQEDAPPADDLRWLLFFEDDELFLHSFDHDFKPLSVDYLEPEFRRRWQALSRNDLLLKALGVKKGVRTVCDATCGLGYDAFLLASATNDRQVKAIVDEVEDKLREVGAKPIRREGERDGRWVLIDYGEIVVHVQHEEERQFYALERLWRDCPTIELPADVVSHER